MGERKPLRIGIDGRDLLAARRTGVERMLYHFVESLPRTRVQGLEYVLFLHDQPPEEVVARWTDEIAVEPIRFPRLQKVADVWVLFQMSHRIAEDRIDAFFTPNTKFPFTSAPCFTTVHGLEWCFSPADYRLIHRVKQWTWFQLCSRYAAGMITFADNTREDMRKLRPDCDIPTCVAPEGVNRLFRQLSPQDCADLESAGVRAPFVLSVCSHEARKNLDALIRAFAIVAQRKPHQLVLAGWPGSEPSRIADGIAGEGLEGRVCLPGYVSDELLLQLYNQADLFVFPSKYEGFGLPLLEAMACGVPIVTSDTSALKEVAGDAAILIDPGSVEDLAAGIGRGLDDTDLRARLVAAGLRRVQEFSWERMTRRICEFMASCLAKEGAMTEASGVVCW